MGWGPVPAIEGLLKKASLGVDDIDRFEINEAFAGQYVVLIGCLEVLLGYIDRFEINEAFAGQYVNANDLDK